MLASREALKVELGQVQGQTVRVEAVVVVGVASKKQVRLIGISRDAADGRVIKAADKGARDVRHRLKGPAKSGDGIGVLIPDAPNSSFLIDPEYQPSADERQETRMGRRVGQPLSPAIARVRLDQNFPRAAP